jgi:hypothetical protein
MFERIECPSKLKEANRVVIKWEHEDYPNAFIEELQLKRNI